MKQERKKGRFGTLRQTAERDLTKVKRDYRSP